MFKSNQHVTDFIIFQIWHSFSTYYNDKHSLNYELIIENFLSITDTNEGAEILVISDCEIENPSVEKKDGQYYINVNNKDRIQENFDIIFCLWYIYNNLANYSNENNLIVVDFLNQKQQDIESYNLTLKTMAPDHIMNKKKIKNYLSAIDIFDINEEISKELFLLKGQKK